MEGKRDIDGVNSQGSWWVQCDGQFPTQSTQNLFQEGRGIPWEK